MTDLGDLKPPVALHTIVGLIHASTFVLQIYNTYEAWLAVASKDRNPTTKRNGNGNSFDHKFFYLSILLLLYEVSNIILSVGFMGKSTNTKLYHGFYLFGDLLHYGVMFMYTIFVVKRYGMLYTVLDPRITARLRVTISWRLLQVVTAIIWAVIAGLVCGCDIYATIVAPDIAKWSFDGVSSNGVVTTFVWNMYVLAMDISVSTALFLRLKTAVANRKFFGKSELGLPTHPTGAGNRKTRDMATRASSDNITQTKEQNIAWTSNEAPVPPVPLVPSLASAATHNSSAHGESGTASRSASEQRDVEKLNGSSSALTRAKKGARQGAFPSLTKSETAALLKTSGYGVVLLCGASILGAVFTVVAQYVYYNENDRFNYGYAILTEIGWVTPIYHMRFAFMYVQAVKKLTSRFKQ
ncbi:hypothetical protein BC832DRAFT_97927 [Gaertneriomyces semiglobifer]|nr:hypothetical protein BC832DRAFT_97927 [Gaertneriomyces semiglobifer]